MNDLIDMAKRFAWAISTPFVTIFIYFFLSFIFGGFLSLVMFQNLLPNYMFFWTSWECLTTCQQFSRCICWIIAIYFGLLYLNVTVFDGDLPS